MNKIETKSTVLLAHHLKALKLPTMGAECEKVAARAAKENADHLAFLLQLCELELLERERKAAERRLKAARFPNHKLLSEFDFAARPSVNKPLVLQLAQGEYLQRRENILLVGPVELDRLASHHGATNAPLVAPESKLTPHDPDVSPQSIATTNMEML